MNCRLTACGRGVIDMAPSQRLSLWLHLQQLVNFFLALDGDGLGPELADPALTAQRRHGVLSGGHIFDKAFVINDQSHI